jgi:hypothetical protein
MALPFSLRGRVEVTESPDVSAAASRLERGLHNLKAKRVGRAGPEIHFTGGIFRLVAANNLLGAVGSGDLSVEPLVRGVAVEYRLRFTQMFLVVSVAVLGFFGPPVMNAPNLTPVEAAVLLSVSWVWLYGANVVLAVIRFPRWIHRTLAYEG